MGVFTRFKDIVNANINSLLDKAEDPEKMLKLMIQEMEDTIIELKTSCSAKMAEEIKLAKKIKEAEAYIERWQQRAKLAVEHGKEDLAREALVEKRCASEAYESMRENLDIVRQSVAEGKEEIKTLEDKLLQAKLKLKNLQEKNTLSRNANIDNHFDLKSRFEAMEEKINRMDAWNDLNRKSETADEKFKKMEKDAEIEKELEALKGERK
mgnify:FL=1